MRDLVLLALFLAIGVAITALTAATLEGFETRRPTGDHIQQAAPPN